MIQNTKYKLEEVLLPVTEGKDKELFQMNNKMIISHRKMCLGCRQAI